MRKKSMFATAICVVALAGLSASSALAGESQGPPGTPGVPFSGSGLRTGAPAHAQSICAYNGLNDMNPAQGPIDAIVQTPHNQGTPGEAGAGPKGSGVPGSPTCGRGTNPELP
jgi:L-2-hydroxyglutarate oxidase LhgO